MTSYSEVKQALKANCRWKYDYVHFYGEKEDGNTFYLGYRPMRRGRLKNEYSGDFNESYKIWMEWPDTIVNNYVEIDKITKMSFTDDPFPVEISHGRAWLHTTDVGLGGSRPETDGEFIFFSDNRSNN